MRPFSEHGDSIANTATRHPLAEEFFASTTVVTGGIEHRATRREHAVEKREAPLAIIRVQRNRALNETGNGHARARDRSVFHRHSTG